MKHNKIRGSETNGPWMNLKWYCQFYQKKLFKWPSYWYF